MKRIADALRNAGKPMSVHDLAVWTDGTPQQVRWLIQHHREAFRIAGWVREPRHIVALFDLADGTPDRPKPRPLSGAEKAARSRRGRRALLAAKARKPDGNPWRGL